MRDFPFDIVLFDLDGTLVDSARDLAPAVNHALAAIGRGPVADAETRNMIGGGTDMMLTRALAWTGGQIDQVQYRKLTQVLLEYYWAHIADNTVPYAGCLEALADLKGNGCTLAVCTNKSEGPARQLLEALGMTDYFAAIYGGDTLGRERAKPAPDMLQAAIADCGGGRAVMVGDTTYDVRAARAANVPAIACSFGYCDVPIEEMAADAIIGDFGSLVPSIKALKHPSVLT